jgi:large subunit ribosomal protein L25
MLEANLKVELRKNTGNQTSKSLRRLGRIPAIFYSHGEEAIPISVEAKELDHLIHGRINIINVIFEKGKTRKSILREIQRDPITDTLVHVDIMGIKLTEKVRINIPIVIIGTPLGVKEGGILEHLLREVQVEGLPLDIPDHIELDVSDLDIGRTVTLENTTIDKVKLLTDIHHPVAHVVQPKLHKVEEVVEEVEVVEGEEDVEKVEEPKTEDSG